MHRAPTQSRYRPPRPRHPISDTIEDENEASAAEASGATATQPVSSGGVGASESNLGESWRTNLAGEVDDSDTPEERENVDAIAGGAGVLGLIQQFQKVSNEGRGRAPVGI